MTLEAQIAEGVAAMGVEVPASAVATFSRYLELIAKWNRVHNLTAVRETDQMVVLHLLDSLPNQDKIVATIVDNLASANPKPMYFRAVPYTGSFEATINDRDRQPVPWDNKNDYVVISIPMKPKNAP